jgi:hypothetical protein
VEGPTARELALPRVNSAAGIPMTVPCSSLSLIRFLFRRWATSHCYSSAQHLRASYLSAGRESDNSVMEGSDAAEAVSDSSTISFVSYFSFASKR